MQLIDLDPTSGHKVDRFGSRFSIRHLVRGADGVQVSFAYLERDGLIGRHPAAGNQILAVVAGSGWVSGEDGVRQPIAAGQAAFWRAGEHHETGADDGLTAVIVEGPGVSPVGV